MTLPEILTALTLLGIVLPPTLTTLQQGLAAYADGARRVEAQQAARVALTRLTREIRGAGRGREDGALAVAEPDRVVLRLDPDGDVEWRLAGTTLRRAAGGGGQPIADDVQRFALAYLDTLGRPTDRPEAVRRVRIALTAGPPGAAAALVTEVRLRNR